MNGFPVHKSGFRPAPKSSEAIAELSEAEIVLPDPEAADVEPATESQAPDSEASTAASAEDEKTDE